MVLVEVAETTSLTDRALRQATVRFKEPVEASVLSSLTNVKIISAGDGLSIKLQVWGDMDGFIKALATLPVGDLETVQPSLEEVFLEYYRAESEPKEVI